MPKKAIPQAPEVAAAIKKISLYSERTDMCIFKLSQAAGVSQSALARFINYKRKTITKTARRVIGYIDKQHKWHNRPKGRHGDVIIPETSDSSSYRLIENAISSIWDGNSQTAEVLASLIKALKPLLDFAAAIDRGDERGYKK